MDNDDQQVVLHPASRKQEVLHTVSMKYTSMFLEIGRFQWKQLSMKTALAVEIFQRTLKLKVPPHELVQKNRMTDILKQAFSCVKSEFSTKITLPYFSKDTETLLQTDASKKGFGAVLVQDNKPVCFTSSTLTPSEKNYLYGGHFTPQSNQKPLVKLFIKYLCELSLKIQRITIHSWQYNFNTVHKSVSANTKNESEYALSRVSPQDIEPNIEQESPIFAVNTLTNFQKGEEKMASMEETAKDPELSALHKLISEGWPPKRSNVPDNLKDYWNYRDEFTVENGILLKSHKFIVPKNLQSIYINKIHAGHLGINKSLQNAQEYLFWKGYTKDISEAIDKCTLRQENVPSNPQHFQYISEVPPHPWHTLGTDLFYHRKQDYVVFVDYFSKFLIVRKLPNSTTGAIVKELSITFSEYGIPFIIWSDNGPYYSSQESKTFVRDLYHVSKNLIEKAIQSDKPWHSFIQEYRITPLSSTIPSPAEILFGRRFRSNLSILPSQLTNSRTTYIREEITKKENKPHEKPTPVADLVPGQPIWHQDPLTKKWLPGAVQEKLQEPHSYSITSQDTTAMYRRNRNHLKPQQVPDAPASATTTEPQENISKDEQATFTPQTNNSIQPSEETCTKVQRISSRSTKGTLPKRYRTEQ